MRADELILSQSSQRNWHLLVPAKQLKGFSTTAPVEVTVSAEISYSTVLCCDVDARHLSSPRTDMPRPQSNREGGRV
jgi:hypothetical protein